MRREKQQTSFVFNEVYEYCAPCTYILNTNLFLLVNAVQSLRLTERKPPQRREDFPFTKIELFDFLNKTHPLLKESKK